MVPTRRLNEQVRRNRERFPEDFMFQLSAEEKAEVIANCDHLNQVPRQYNPTDEAQLLNELKTTGQSVGLLINFGREKVEFKRMIFSDPSAFNPR